MKDDKKRGIGLQYALNGIKEAFLQERNFRIHLMAALVVLIASVYFQLDVIEWIIILLVIKVVLITELINSVIERLIDYLKPEIHPKAKVIKDMAASVVLIGAMFASIIGVIIFLPKLINL